jgi:anti-anti-sigma factor
MPLDIGITKVNPGTYKVKLSGTLDTQTAATLDRRMDPIVTDPKVRTLVLELHELNFISSAGMGSIAKIKKAIAGNRGSVVTVGAQPQIVRVFDIVKLLPKETVFTTIEEADAYLAAIQNQVIEENREPPKSFE